MRYGMKKMKSKDEEEMDEPEPMGKGAMPPGKPPDRFLALRQAARAVKAPPKAERAPALDEAKRAAAAAFGRKGRR